MISLVFGDSAPGLLHLLAEPGGAVMVLAHPGGAAGECFSLLELAIMAGSGAVASAIIAELGSDGGDTVRLCCWLCWLCCVVSCPRKSRSLAAATAVRRHPGAAVGAS